jgi:hypothetical protein
MQPATGLYYQISPRATERRIFGGKVETVHIIMARHGAEDRVAQQIGQRFIGKSAPQSADNGGALGILDNAAGNLR